MKQISSIIIIFIHLIFIKTYSSEISIPFGSNILPNGKFSKNEWTDADSCLLGDSIKFCLKLDEEFVYLALKFLQEKHTGIDLYLADSETNLKNLHISSALGERNFKDNKWEKFGWGENIFCMGNSIGSVFADGKMTYLDPDGFEFQIDKTMFKRKTWFLRIHLKRPEYIFPISTENNNIENWFWINLEKAIE